MGGNKTSVTLDSIILGVTPLLRWPRFLMSSMESKIPEGFRKLACGKTAKASRSPVAYEMTFSTRTERWNGFTEISPAKIRQPSGLSFTPESNQPEKRRLLFQNQPHRLHKAALRCIRTRVPASRRMPSFTSILNFCMGVEIKNPA